MIGCLLPIRRGRRSAWFHEVGMADLTAPAPKRRFNARRSDRASRSFMNMICKKQSVALAAPAPPERAPASGLACGSLEVGSLRGATGRIGGGIKMAPGGPRKPLKRLDTDKGIKVNSKENPTKIQTIPRIFQRFFKEIKGFPRNANARGSSRHGTSTAAPSSLPARKSSSASLALSSGYDVVVVRTFARGARARNSSPSARVRLATE